MSLRCYDNSTNADNATDIARTPHFKISSQRRMGNTMSKRFLEAGKDDYT